LPIYQQLAKCAPEIAQIQNSIRAAEYVCAAALVRTHVSFLIQDLSSHRFLPRFCLQARSRSDRQPAAAPGRRAAPLKAQARLLGCGLAVGVDAAANFEY